MTTPSSDPGSTVPPDPAVGPEEAAAQAVRQAAAEASAALNDQIRALATEMAKQTLLAFDPATLRKGTVVSVQNTALPPTITVTISGDTLEIPGVVYYEHYSPEASDVVHLIKQGTDLAAIGKIAAQHSETDFTAVSPAAGFTTNGNGNGDFKIRRVWDHGVWRVDLQGSVARSSGTTIATGLDTKYRPTSATRRSLTCARDGTTMNSVKVDFNNDGTVTMIGGTTATGTADPGDTNSATPAESTHSHGSHEHGIPDSTHQHGSHSHSIPNTAHEHTGTTTVVSGHEHGIPVTNHSHGGTTGGNVAGPSTHSHSGTTTVTTPNDSSHTHGGHAHTMPTHAHTGTDPTWISFNGQSYFL